MSTEPIAFPDVGDRSFCSDDSFVLLGINGTPTYVHTDPSEPPILDLGNQAQAICAS